MKQRTAFSIVGTMVALFVLGVLSSASFLSAQTGTTDTTTTLNTSVTTTSPPPPPPPSTTDTSATTSGSPGTTYVDTIPPMIKLLGDGTIYIKTGAIYSDPGAVAYDNLDGEISSRIIRDGKVNVTIPGVYHIMYGISDRVGNLAKVVRTVYVVAPPTVASPPPIIPPPILSPEPIKTNTISGTGSTTPIVPVRPVLTATTTAIYNKLEQERIRRCVETGNIECISRVEGINNTTKATTSTPKIFPPVRGVFPRATTTDITDSFQVIEEAPELVQQKIQKVIERVQAKPDETKLDSDHDGISDYDEQHIYGTDPNNPDTDGDGYSDRSEITTGFDPKNPHLHAIIIYENPKEKGEIKKDILSVAAIAAAEIKPEGEPQATSTITFKGKGLPNSFVTVYIFSTPTVVTVKTDSEGNWEYTLDKELADGNHEMYVAMTDNAGKILAKSTAIPFVKEANAITVDQNLLTPITGGKPASLFTAEYVYAAITVVLSAIGIVFSIIGMRAQPNYRRYRNPTGMKDDTEDDHNHA